MLVGPRIVAEGKLLGLVRSAGFERVAARDLQKSVLLGLARHLSQVPGPLTQGFEGFGVGIFIGVACITDVGG